MSRSGRKLPWTPLQDRLRRRVRDWALRRQGPDTLPQALRARRLYILPTRAGVAFAGLAAVMFVAGMNYGSGLAMLLCFWLAGFLVMAMLQTHRGLSGARLLSAQASPAFAGGTAQLALALQANAPAGALLLREAGSPGGTPGTIQPDGTTLIALDLPAPRRGQWTPPALELQTRAPFGLFRCWTLLLLPVTTDVYPAPVGTRAAPVAHQGQSGHSPAEAGHDELTWLRPFREGDSPRQVAWKAYARGMPLLVREYRGTRSQGREFRFDTLQGLDTEQRLSQLARWVVDSAARQEDYAMVLPGQPRMHGAGPAHRDRCLVALARF